MDGDPEVKPSDPGLDDINDAFEALAFPEDGFTRQGYDEGRVKGRYEGRKLGFHLGYHHGLNVGMEIGFYRGVVRTLTDPDAGLNTRQSEKAMGQLSRLDDLLTSFPDFNSETVNIESELSDIRVTYRKLVSLLKLKLSLPSGPPMSF